MRIIVLLLCAAISPVLWVLYSCGDPPPPPCGDGFRVAAPSTGRESCDDGNTAGGDTCSPTCQSVSLLVDGNVDDFEWFAYPEPRGAAMGSDLTGDILAVWTREYPACVEIRAKRFTSAGVPVATSLDATHGTPCAAQPADGSFIIASSTVAELEPTVVGLVDGWAVAYTEHRFGTLDIVTQVVGPSGTLGFRWVANHSEGAPLIPGDQTAPQLAAHSLGYVVAWVDENGGNGTRSEIWARHYNGDGTPLQNQPIGNPFLIASDPAASMSQLSLAGESNHWAATWLYAGQENEIHLRRFSDLAAVDVQPMTLATNATTPEISLSYGGTVFVGYRTEYPFDAHVVRVDEVTSAIETVISFDDPDDPSERILSLSADAGPLLVAYVEDNTASLEARWPAAPFDPAVGPVEWTAVAQELADSFDTNVRLHWGTRGPWLAWSGIGAGTLDLGFSIYLVPPEFTL